MTARPFVVAGVALVSLACGRGVAERVPSAGQPQPDDPSFGYVGELADLVIPSGLENDHLKSPDGKLMLALTHDESLTGQQTGLYGVELVEQASARRHPILSLWEADAGSGILINVRWSADSRAVRLKGATKGFRRHHRQFGTFDLLYLVDTDRFLDLLARRASNRWSTQHAI
jgi:hypothetical protein